ncbi:Metallo-dependent phosphatase-like protein [Hyaloraphidium curvatum]|nr:Metallo-dependent phosphatase-like protein [Hyaloraphidium curvatum]
MVDDGGQSRAGAARTALYLLLLLFLARPAAAGPFPRRAERRQTSPAASFRIAHVNDVHAHYDEFNAFFTDCIDSDRASGSCFGGVARQKTVVDRLRTEAAARGQPFLLVDAGDEYQGTLFYTYWKKHGMNITAEILNELGVDTVTLGNHDFDDGPEGLAPMLRLARSSAVAANVAFKDPSIGQHVKPSAVVKPANSTLQIGIVGISPPETADISNSGPNVSFSGVFPAVQKAIDELRARNISCIVVVSHIGYAADKSMVAQLSGAQVVIGGHSHTLLLGNGSAATKDPVGGPYPTIEKNLDGKQAFIVQAMWAGKYMGVIDVDVDENCDVLGVAGAPVLLDQSIPQDPVLQAKVREWRKPFDELSAEVLGTAERGFVRDNCFSRDCAIGNYVADCMMRTVPASRLAILNSGVFRVDVPQGNVTVGTILSLLPFANYLVRATYTGRQILETLEVVATGPNVTNDFYSPPKNVPKAFAQVSGVRFRFDDRLPVGKRVTQAQIAEQGRSGVHTGWEAIDPAANYSLLTIDFLASGGDALLKPPPALSGQESILLSRLDDAVMDCIRQDVVMRSTEDGRICNAGMDCPWAGGSRTCTSSSIGQCPETGCVGRTPAGECSPLILDPARSAVPGRGLRAVRVVLPRRRRRCRLRREPPLAVLDRVLHRWRLRSDRVVLRRRAEAARCSVLRIGGGVRFGVLLRRALQSVRGLLWSERGLRGRGTSSACTSSLARHHVAEETKPQLTPSYPIATIYTAPLPNHPLHLAHLESRLCSLGQSESHVLGKFGQHILYGGAIDTQELRHAPLHSGYFALHASVSSPSLHATQPPLLSQQEPPVTYPIALVGQWT